MRNSREIKEEIEDLSVEARGIFEAARDSGREMTEEEVARFDLISDESIPALKKELETTIQREDKVKRLSQERHREARARELSNAVDQAVVDNGVGLPEAAPRRNLVPAMVRVSKLKAFKSDEDAFNAGMWLRAVTAREYRSNDIKAEQYLTRIGWSLDNAQTEGTGSAGGYIVPQPLSQTIIDVREEVGIMRRVLNVMPMTSNTMDVAKRSGGLTVFNGTEAPAQDMTASVKDFATVALVAKKRYVVNQISQELQDDAIINIVDDIVSEMAYALALREDEEALLGDGTGTYNGVQGLPGIGSAGIYTAGTGDDTWAELEMVDFTSTMGKLPSRFWTAPGTMAWVCSASFYYDVMVRLMAVAGGNVFSSIEAGSSAQPRFLGYPVFFSDRLPRATAANTVCAYFGNWQQLGILGDRVGIRIARSDDFAFLRDLTTLKATARYDIVLHELGDATDAGAVVALRTAS